MSMQIVPFQFNAHNLRVHIADDETLWWEAQDVCAILHIMDVSQAVARLSLGEKRTCETRNVLIINESGLYRLIFRSNKPEAREFQDWVFGTVLPSIRKTGSYSVTPPAVNASDSPCIPGLAEYCFLRTAVARYDRTVALLAATIIAGDHYGDQLSGVAEWFLRVHDRLVGRYAPETRAEIFWQIVASTPPEWCALSVTPIGPLLEDLASGLPFAACRERFAAVQAAGMHL